MNAPGFRAEASLGGLRVEYISGSAEFVTRTEAKIVPQLRIIWESCRPVSAFYSVCGCEDEETGTSHWFVIR